MGTTATTALTSSPQGIKTFPRLQTIYPIWTFSAYNPSPRLTLLQFISFTLSVSSVQNVTTITYRMGLTLHFAFAGMFYIGAAVTSIAGTFQEFRYRKTHSHEKVQDSIRYGLNVTSLLIMLLTWLLFLFSTFTYLEISRIDQRPPVIWAELAGVGGFLVYCGSLVPYLDRGGEGGREGEEMRVSEEKDPAYL